MYIIIGQLFKSSSFKQLAIKTDLKTAQIMKNRYAYYNWNCLQIIKL